MSPKPFLLDPEKTRLLVIDVQNDFCHERGAFAQMGVPMGPIQAMVPRLDALIEGSRRAGVPVIFVQTEHGRWTNSKTWLTRRVADGGRERVYPCAEGSWGAEFYGVKPTPADRIVTKHRYSGFVGTDLDVILRSQGVTHVLATGVTTNVCVESTARDAFMRDYHAILVEDCCAAASPEEHQGALTNMRTYFGEVRNAGEVLAGLGQDSLLALSPQGGSK